MSAIFPGVPGNAQPGAFTPGDPGAATSGVGGGVNVLNQWTDAITADYGLQIIPVGNSTGHALVAFIGWNSTGLMTGTIPFVADDAHNWWVPLYTAPSAGANCGVSVWVAPNANPAEFVSVSTSRPTTGLAILIVEMTGLPNFVVPDLLGGVSISGGAGSETLSGTAGASDMAFTVLVSSNNLNTVTPPGGGWNALTTVSINDPGGAGGPADTKLTPLYQQVSPGAVSASWSWTGTMTPTGALCAMNMITAGTLQANPNWPSVKVEAAFGFQPGNPVIPLAWTDISSYAISENGQTIMSATRGRSYELTSPEAGTLKIMLNNLSGAFNPSNQASPFWPNVRPGVPIRVSAVWNGRTYAIGYGFMDRWRQTFPTNQWGFAETQASDGMGVLANITLFSAYQSEVLLDTPYAYWPLGEDYSAPLGLPFNNIAPGNAHPLLGLYGLSQSNTNVPLSCGLALNLNGDIGTGIGISSMTAEPPTWSAGALEVDPKTPWPAAAGSSITVEFVTAMTTNTTAVGGDGKFDYDVPLVSLLGQPSNYPTGSGQVRFTASAKWVQSGSVSSMHTVMGDFSGNIFSDTNGTLQTDGLPHHHAYVITWSGSSFSAVHYVDGIVSGSTVTYTGVTNSNDIYQVVVGPAFISPLQVRPFNYTIGHVAIYTGQLSGQRISAHAQAALNGWTGDTALKRFSRVMSYGQSGLARAGAEDSASPLFGFADTLAGQANVDGLNDMSVTEGGQPFADAAGNVWYLTRTAFYDTPVKWFLGDNPVSGETVYLPDATFDFDNTYIYNQLVMQRQISQSNVVTTTALQGALVQQFTNLGAEAVAADVTSEQEYFLRNSLQQTVLSGSDEDVYDKANWSLTKYKQPALRLPKVTLDPASNPSIWPVALGIEQGDVIQVARRPVGGTPYIVQGIVQRIEHKVGPNMWQVTLSIAPYTIEAAILNVGQPGYDTLAEGVGW